MDVSGMFQGAITNVILTLVATFIIGAVIIVWARKAFGPNKKLLQSGIPARGTILRVWQTGTLVNNQPQIGLTLQIDGHPMAGSYQTETKVVIPMIAIPQFQPGAVLPVKVDPTNPQKIALDIYGSV